MKNKIYLIITGLVVLLLFGFIFSVINEFAGNPISKAIASNSIKAYVADNYEDMGLELSETTYNFKFDEYTATAQSQISEDTYFNLYYTNGKVTDAYEGDVLSGWNTFERLDDEFRIIVEPMIEEKMSYDFDMVIAGIDKEDEFSSGALTLDMDFDLHNIPLSTYVTVYVFSDDVSWDNIAKVAVELDNLMIENEIKIDQYDVILKPTSEKVEKKGESLGVYDFPQELLAQDNLPKVLQEYFEKWEREADASKK